MQTLCVVQNRCPVAWCSAAGVSNAGSDPSLLHQSCRSQPAGLGEDAETAGDNSACVRCYLEQALPCCYDAGLVRTSCQCQPCKAAVSLCVVSRQVTFCAPGPFCGCDGKCQPCLQSLCCSGGDFCMVKLLLHAGSQIPRQGIFLTFRSACKCASRWMLLGFWEMGLCCEILQQSHDAEVTLPSSSCCSSQSCSHSLQYH